MNQQELINKIHGSVRNEGWSKATVKSILDELADIAQAELMHGGEVVLPGLGKLSIKARAARTGRNPATGEEINIAAKNVPHFSAAKALKDAVA